MYLNGFMGLTSVVLLFLKLDTTYTDIPQQ